jgi:hypothetical protein
MSVARRQALNRALTLFRSHARALTTTRRAKSTRFFIGITRFELEDKMAWIGHFGTTGEVLFSRTVTGNIGALFVKLILFIGRNALPCCIVTQHKSISI